MPDGHADTKQTEGTSTSLRSVAPSACLIFCVALAARAAFALLYGGSEPAAKFGGNKEDPQAYLWIAENFCDHGTLGFRGEPSARRAPAYPLLLAALTAIGGGDLLAVRLAQGALDAITAVMVFAAVLNFASRRAALISGLLYAAYPIYIFNTSEIMTEVLVLSFTALATWAASRSLLRRSTLAAALAGMACGLLALTRENNLLLVPLWAGVLVWAGCRRGRRAGLLSAIRRPAVLLAAALLTYAPWVVRNSLLFHTFVPTGTSGGENLLRSMGIAREGESFDWPRCLEDHGLLNYWAYHNPANRGSAFPDELASDRAARELASTWIRENPARFATYGVEKLARIFTQIDVVRPAARGGTLRDVLTWSYRTVAVLGLIGAALLLRAGRGDLVALLAALTLTCVVVLFLFCAWKRYRYVAFDFACILTAGAALDWMLSVPVSFRRLAAHGAR
ncbi:MAG: glycosyltransferase family 39 protein [Phycisphaerales bacterium]|nr:glycosyltransferase family 39 protein [Phycisphaerales bacterium]